MATPLRRLVLQVVPRRWWNLFAMTLSDEFALAGFDLEKGDLYEHPVSVALTCTRAHSCGTALCR